MSEVRDFLVELGTEELPPKALYNLSYAFLNGLRAGLDKAELSYDKLTPFAAPRRLAVKVDGLQVKQSDKNMERRGPALKAAFKEDGTATPAAEGFARSCGVSVDQLETLKTDQGEWLAYTMQVDGKASAELLPGIVEDSLNKLPIPKRMRWGDFEHQFVRPVHWLVMLQGNEVIECEILGQKAGRNSLGHRFHHPAAISIPNPGAYAALMETEGHVLTEFARRRKAIEGQVEEAALKVGGKAVIDRELLDEVTGLVEWPVAVLGNFEERFLEVPAECLISAMKGHQKYFHVVNTEGKLLPHFITVANIDSKNIATVQAGNERVIRPRLSDADFFWNQDLKKKLTDHLESLKTIVFQNKLGSLHDKVERTVKLASTIAQTMGWDVIQAERAALLSKCDLMSEMVFEFPELQGIMGEYYARHDGEDEAVAKALNEQYMPRFGGDVVPTFPISQCVAIADKLDTLMGIFGIGQTPSGDKDPFGLRRAALGVQRIIIENNLDLDLKALLDAAAGNFGSVKLADDTSEQVFTFMMERLRGYFHDQGFSADVFDAVIGVAPVKPAEFAIRLQAVADFRQREEAASLAAANKRIRNILKKVEGELPGTIDDKLLSETQEQALYSTLTNLEEKVNAHFSKSEYSLALGELASLKAPVDDFFDNVMVNAEDQAVRNNRLAMLNRLSNLFLGVADISRLQ